MKVFNVLKFGSTRASDENGEWAKIPACGGILPNQFIRLSGNNAIVLQPTADLG
jgi:hypothetical protein